MMIDRQNLEILGLFLLLDVYIAIWLVYFVYFVPYQKATLQGMGGHVQEFNFSKSELLNVCLKPLMRWTKRTFYYLLIVATIIVLAAFYFVFRGKRYSDAGPVNSAVISSFYEQDTLMIHKLSTSASAMLASNTDSAIHLLEEALHINKKYEMANIEVKILAQLAQCYIRKGDFYKTINYLDTAFAKVKEVNDPDLVAILHNASAIIYQQNGKFSKSIYHYFEGLNSLNEAGLSKSLRAAKLYSNLAGLFILLEEPKQSLQFLNEAKTILDPSNQEHKMTLAYVLCNSGIIKASTQQSDAYSELERSLAFSKEINDPYLSNKILVNLSDLSLNAKNYIAVDNQLEEALQMAKRTKNPISMLLTDYGIGHSQVIRKEYAKAIVNLEKAYQASIAIDYNDALLIITKELKDAYSAIGNYEKAFEFQERYLKRKDDVQQTQKKQTFELLLQYQAAEKDKELAKSQLEINQHESRIKMKNIWIGVFVVGMFLLLILLLIMLTNYRNKQKLQNEKIKNVEQQRDMEKLSAAFEGEERERTRISRDIHDGVMSTFATVRMKIKKLETELPNLSESNDYSSTMHLFDKATNELRMTAHNLMPDLLLEDGLMKAVYYYAKSFEENSGIKILVESFGEEVELPQNFLLFLYRAIQELIQNVIKHAEASQILIQIIFGNATLNITVEDNGKGMSVGNQEGIGLKSLRNRTKLYNGTLNIESRTGEGTSVTLDFGL